MRVWGRLGGREVGVEGGEMGEKKYERGDMVSMMIC